MMPEPKIPRLLYLDSDYIVTLAKLELAGVEIELIPEMVSVIESDLLAKWMPKGVKIREDMALISGLDRMSVYEPTGEILEKIRELTESGEIDLVVIGNNMGAGVTKARCVAAPLRERTIIIGNTRPRSEDYARLGYTLFASRGLMYVQLLELLRRIG